MTRFIRLRLNLLVLIFSLFAFSEQTYTQVLFAPEQVVFESDDHTYDTYVSLVGDIDGDGDLDVLVNAETGSQVSNKLSWHENLNGLGLFSLEHEIDYHAGVFEKDQILLQDFDLDGDLDIVVAEASNFFLYENQDGLGSFNEKQLIANVGNSTICCLTIADFDQDGDLDIAYGKPTSNESKIAWIENFNDLVGFSEEQVLDTGVIPKNMVIEDFDEDGDLDLIACFRIPNIIRYYENNGEQNVFGAPQTIYEGENGLNSIRAVDLDNDTHKDLLIIYSHQKISWIPNISASLSIEDEIIIDDQGDFIQPRILIPSDVDSDGDIDLLYYRSEAIKWFENTGNTEFNDIQILLENRTDVNGIITNDINQDNFNDLLIYGNGSATDLPQKIYWLQNIAGTNQFGNLNNIGHFGTLNRDGTLVDIDNDGDKDLLFYNYLSGLLIWYPNIADNSPVYLPPKVFANNLEPIHFVDYAKINDDDLPDVIGNDNLQQQVMWFSNDSTMLGSPQVIIDTLEYTYIRGLTYCDLDNDGGDLDFIYSKSTELLWSENIGDGIFEESQVIGSLPVVATVIKIICKDIDNDLDVDIFVECRHGFPSDVFFIWFEHLDGTDDFKEGQIIGNLMSASNSKLHDVDNDGDLDVFIARNTNDDLSWFENLDGQGTFSNEQVILELDVSIADYIFGDLNKDGYDDFVASLHGGDIMFFMHTGDEELFEIPEDNIEVGDAINPYYPIISLLDYDNDGDLDVFSEVTKKTSWYENLLDKSVLSGTLFYDINQNGIQDITDVALANMPVSIEPESRRNFSNDDGLFQFIVDDGVNYIETGLESLWSITTDSLNYTVLSDGSNITGLNFGFYPNTELTQMSSQISSAPTRCFSLVPFWFTVQNTGTEFTSGQLVLEIDPSAYFHSSEPYPDSIYQNKLFWNFENFPPLQHKTFELNLEMSAIINTRVEFSGEVWLQDSLGVLSKNEECSYSSVIICSYDPNDKLVIPVGEQDAHYTLLGEELEYTIRFQNVGTDTAFTVRVEDQLDSDLDWSTFRPITASHDYIVNLFDNGRVEFLFEDILLVDSFTNEVASNGFVKYKINHLENLPSGTEVTNYARIFFDFNEPIQTNTTLNTFVTEIPTSVSETALQILINIFPNPFDDNLTISIDSQTFIDDAKIVVHNSLGQLVNSYQIESGQSLTIFSEKWPPGLYVCSLIGSKKETLAQYKIIKL